MFDQMHDDEDCDDGPGTQKGQVAVHKGQGVVQESQESQVGSVETSVEPKTNISLSLSILLSFRRLLSQPMDSNGLQQRGDGRNDVG